MSRVTTTTDSDESTGTIASVLRTGREFFARLGVLLAASLVAGVIFQATTGVFFSIGNFGSILLFMTSVAIVGYGMTLVVVAGELDLSVGSVYGLSAMVTGLLWAHGWPLPGAMVAGVAAGALCGLFNGLMVTRLGVNSFITTLGTLNLFLGITLYISNNVAFSPSSDLPGYGLYQFIGTSYPFGVPVQIYTLVIATAVMWVLLHRTVFGFRIAAIGGNATAARAAHLPVKRVKVMTFVICGMLAAVAGIIDFSLVSSVSPMSGSTLMFSVLAAVIIGGASLSGGRGTILGTLVGALLLQVLTNGLGLLGAGAYAQFVFQGGVILVAVAVDRWTSRSRALTEVQL